MKLDVKVGDTVQLHTRRRDYSRKNGTFQTFYTDVVEEATITRVGRTLVYVQLYSREAGFYKENGLPRRNDHGHGWRMYTAETLAETLRRREVVDTVQERTRSHAWTNALSTEALEAIAEILTKESTK